MKKRLQIKHSRVALCLGLTITLSQSALAVAWVGGTAKFEDPTAWGSGSVPSSASQEVWKTVNDGSHITADAATWTYLTDNNLLNNSTRYRGVNRSIFGGTAGTAEAIREMSFTFDIGAGNQFQLTENKTNNFGERDYTDFTFNLVSGYYSTGGIATFGNKATAVSNLNIYADGKFATARSNLVVGAEGSNATVRMFGGELITREGLIVDTNSTFEVHGGASTIGIGSNGSIDGFANINGTLKAMIGDDGLSTIFVDAVDSASANATLGAGSLLDVSYLSDAGAGSWTVLEVEGASIVNDGISFASDVDTDVWSFAVIDGEDGNGRLTVTAAAVPEPSSFALLAGIFAIASIATKRRR